MDVHVEEQPHVRRIVCKNSHIVCEELLHDPFILPSHHLNVTVIVQDKDRTGPASELRAVGRAVLDTANYSEDFISFNMLEKLNATHLCYPAPTAITVCSGLDGQCYVNNEICDLKILFHSYDGECQSISLPMRHKGKSLGEGSQGEDCRNEKEIIVSDLFRMWKHRTFRQRLRITQGFGACDAHQCRGGLRRR